MSWIADGAVDPDGSITFTRCVKKAMIEEYEEYYAFEANSGEVQLQRGQDAPGCHGSNAIANSHWPRFMIGMRISHSRVC